jgi:lipid II:glycine glycyltransferase (peptidoglycan interpeptide bridge formation enzyme)
MRIGVRWDDGKDPSSISAPRPCFDQVTIELTIHADIDALRQRIAKAEAARDTWRAAGRQENYLEAYSMVEALESQLDQLERTRRRLAAAVAIPIRTP